MDRPQRKEREGGRRRMGEGLRGKERGRGGTEKGRKHGGEKRKRMKKELKGETEGGSSGTRDLAVCAEASSFRSRSVKPIRPRQQTSLASQKGSHSS